MNFLERIQAKSLFFSILEGFNRNPFEKILKNEDFWGFLAFFCKKFQKKFFCEKIGPNFGPQKYCQKNFILV